MRSRNVLYIVVKHLPFCRPAPFFNPQDLVHGRVFTPLHGAPARPPDFDHVGLASLAQAKVQPKISLRNVPAAKETSLNFPLRRFQYNVFRSRKLVLKSLPSTSGYTCPLAMKMSGQPSLSTSTNSVPQPRDCVLAPNPASSVASVKVPSLLL